MQTFIHIGYPKSASTTLQTKLFACHSEIKSFSKYEDRWCDFYNALKAKAPPFAGDDGPTGGFGDDVFSNLSATQRNVISDEGFLNQYHASHASNAEKAARLKRLFPDAKIVVVLRNQLQLLRSFYDYQSPKGTIDQWLASLLTADEEGQRLLRSLDFYEAVRLYTDLFGEERVQILLMEDLQDAFESFCRTLCEFMNISVEETMQLLNAPPTNDYRSVDVQLRRLRSRFLPGVPLSRFAPSVVRKPVKAALERFLARQTPARSRMSDRNASTLTRLYAPCNRKLVQMTGLDLGARGYPV
jgi:hypothetical protein